MNHQLAQQIRKYLVLGVSLARTRPGCDGADAHLDHERAHVKSAHPIASLPKRSGELARTHEGKIQMKPIHRMHDAQIRFADGFGQVVDSSTTDR